MRRQHAVKRLSLHSGLLWFQASTNLNKAVSEYPKSSVCRAVRPRRSSRPGDLSGGQDSICRSWPTLPLLLQSPATSCALLCCLLTSSSARRGPKRCGCQDISCLENGIQKLRDLNFEMLFLQESRQSLDLTARFEDCFAARRKCPCQMWTERQGSPEYTPALCSPESLRVRA